MIRLACIALIAASPALAQVKETIHVNLVEVPVTVVDRAGNPVRGLTAANFELIDERQKRPITSFDVIDLASPASRKSLSPLNPAARRSFLLLFDLSFSSPLGRAKAQEAARNFIARNLQGRDLAAVGTLDVDRGFRLVTAFTTDRSLLTAAIADPINFVATDPLQIAGTQVYEAPPPAATQVLQATGNDRGAAAEQQQAELQRMQSRMDESFSRARIERQLDMLGGMARTLRTVPGRKQVVFFSEGFDPKLVQGRDARATADAMTEFNQAVTGEAWKIDSDLRYGSTRSLSALDKMARMFRGSDAVLQAVDIKGVRVENDLQRGATLNSNEGLFVLAKPTGGEVFRNSNNLNNDLERMLRQQEVIYVLGFQAPNGNPGRYHELRVKLRDVPGGHPFHRAGYYENGSENALERALSTSQIILNDVAQTDVRFDVLAAPFPTHGHNSQVPVILEINGEDLARDAKSNVINAEIYVYAFDEDGLVRDRMFQRVVLDLAKIGEKLRQSGIKYYTSLSLPEGRYAVKSLVRVPETERKGFARNEIYVPPATDVALLPPLFFEEPGKWLMVKGGSHDPQNAGYPFQINGEPFIPSAAVKVHNGETRQFAVFVYNAAADEVAWETSVSDADGTSHPASPSLLKQLQGDDVTKLMFNYAPERVAPSAARFDVTIKKKGSSEARSSSVPLSVQR